MSTYAMIVREGHENSELVCVKGFSMTPAGGLLVLTPASHGIPAIVKEYRAISEAAAVQYTLPSRLGYDHGVLVTTIIVDSSGKTPAKIAFTYKGVKLEVEVDWFKENKLHRAGDAIKARLEEHHSVIKARLQEQLFVDDWRRSLPCEMYDVDVNVENEHIRIQGKVFGVPFSLRVPLVGRDYQSTLNVCREDLIDAAGRSVRDHLLKSRTK